MLWCVTNRSVVTISAAAAGRAGTQQSIMGTILLRSMLKAFMIEFLEGRFGVGRACRLTPPVAQRSGRPRPPPATPAAPPPRENLLQAARQVIRADRAPDLAQEAGLVGPGEPAPGFQPLVHRRVHRIDAEQVHPAQDE